MQVRAGTVPAAYAERLTFDTYRSAHLITHIPVPGRADYRRAGIANGFKVAVARNGIVESRRAVAGYRSGHTNLAYFYSAEAAYNYEIRAFVKRKLTRKLVPLILILVVIESYHVFKSKVARLPECGGFVRRVVHGIYVHVKGIGFHRTRKSVFGFLIGESILEIRSRHIVDFNGFVVSVYRVRVSHRALVYRTRRARRSGKVSKPVFNHVARNAVRRILVAAFGNFKRIRIFAVGVCSLRKSMRVRTQAYSIITAFELVTHKPVAVPVVAVVRFHIFYGQGKVNVLYLVGL